MVFVHNEPCIGQTQRQDKASEGFVMFLSIVIAAENMVLLAWSVVLFVTAYKTERDAEKARELEAELAANGGFHVKRETLLDIVKDKRRWVQSRLTSEETVLIHVKSNAQQMTQSYE
jgi:hypothetical protein